MAAIMYARIPLPPKQVNATQANLTRVASMLKYSAIPPHTPQIFLSCVLLYNFLLIAFSSISHVMNRFIFYIPIVCDSIHRINHRIRKLRDIILLM